MPPSDPMDVKYPHFYSSMRKQLTGATNIVQLPLAFVRSGVVWPGDGQVGYVSYYGYSWSRTSESSTDAYYLSFGTTNVNPSYSSVRFYGRPLRCLYPGSA